jgi:hypothetical protein
MREYIQFIFIFILFPLLVTAQITTGSINGTIRATTGEFLPGASIKMIHDPTATTYFSQTGKAGNFVIHNLQPGGPYTVEVSFINYDTEKKQDIHIRLGENLPLDLRLTPHAFLLKQVFVSVARKTNSMGNASGGTVIGQDKIAVLPTIGGNLHDYLRTVPKARLIEGNDGAISVAGQNNRYNNFYIDGSVNNDVFGLASSGTNSGQAAVPPLPIDAIDQLQVTVSPYDASLGNFTGAAINAVTRSGSNRTENSFYLFFSNRNLTGKTPTSAKELAAKPGIFSRSIYGFRWQGAITKNKIFYFVNMELQREIHTQPFSFSEYRGNTKNINLLRILSNTIKGTYQYDPGTFLDNPESVHAERIVTRFDWNINSKHRLSLSNRYSYAQRMNTGASNANTIHFSNDGYALLSGVQSVSVELKSSINHNAANKLLLTYTGVKDDREPLQRAFPRVRINDGEGALIFGTDNSSTINLLIQKNWTLFDKYTFMTGKHAFSIGTDIEHNKLSNAFIQNTFGSYTYFSLADFLTNNRPSAYQVGFSMTDDKNTDHTAAATKLAVLKISVFAHDEMRLNHLVVNYGLRIDHQRFLTSPAEDDYTNTVAIPAFAQYWDLQGARSGLRIKVPVSVSPRLGFGYKMPDQNITLRGGFGIFSGRLPLAWPGGAYNNNGIFIGGFIANTLQLNTIRFRSDPYRQWMPAEFGAAVNKEPLNLTTEKFSMPKLWRASLAMDKKIGKEWSATLELLFSKNLCEIKYTNINLLPPVANAAGADNRNIFSITNNGKIPLQADGSNPYDYAILLGNNKNRTGYACDLTANISGRFFSKWTVEINYHFGHSTATNDGTSSINVSQWRLMETVNGRNFITRSTSDFSPGHSIFTVLNKTFRYRASSMATMVSLVYMGQSGSPVSYVYDNGSMTRDDGVYGSYDLIYVPSSKDLAGMIFLPNTVNGIIYTPQQQKDAFEKYISEDVYLKKHRGKYAERNGSRTPFTHVIDLKIKQMIKIKTGKKTYMVDITCDIFNLTNLLNRNWGRRYFQPNDNLSVLEFAGYVSPTDFIPQYKFNPALAYASKWHVSQSLAPAYSARWNAQLGIRLVF